MAENMGTSTLERISASKRNRTFTLTPLRAAMWIVG